MNLIGFLKKNANTFYVDILKKNYESKSALDQVIYPQPLINERLSYLLLVMYYLFKSRQQTACFQTNKLINKFTMFSSNNQFIFFSGLYPANYLSRNIEFIGQ